MKSCEYYEELMSRLLDEGVDQRSEAELRTHLRTCPDCQRLFSVLSGMTLALREDQADPPAALATGVMARIAAENKTASRWTTRSRRTPTWPRLVAAACLVLIVGAGAMVSLRSVRGGGSTGVASITADAAYNMSSAAQEPAMEMAPAPRGVFFEESEAEEGVDAGGAVDMDDVPMALSDAAPVLTGLAVYGPDGSLIGSISPDSTPALTALLTEADPGTDGLPETDWDVICTVEYDGVTYTLGTDSDRMTLVWWTAGTNVSLSPGTAAQLEALIQPVS